MNQLNESMEDTKVYLALLKEYYEFKLQPFKPTKDSVYFLFNLARKRQEKIQKIDSFDLKIFSEFIEFETVFYNLVIQNKQLLIDCRLNIFVDYLCYVQRIIIRLFPTIAELSTLYLILEKANRIDDDALISDTLLEIHKIIDVIV